MKTKVKKELRESYKEDKGEEFKRIRWETITVETKEHPIKPKALITGTVQAIYPDGDVAFSKITKVQTWNMETDTIKDIKIPSVYMEAKKVVIRREIIAAVIYVKELAETNPQNPITEVKK